jgi:CubicO group peptidase (beta-lactamase class C family)
MRYTGHVLDFQPGTATGYSATASFDILGYVITLVSKMSLEEYLKQEIFTPLDMTSTTFFLNEAQKARLVTLYKYDKGRLKDVTGTKDDMYGILKQGDHRFEAGCGGLFGTVTDYDNMINMLLRQGNHNGRQFMKPETVELIHTEAQQHHLEPEPGFVWGLGVKIRQNPWEELRNSRYLWVERSIRNPFHCKPERSSVCGIHD